MDERLSAFVDGELPDAEAGALLDGIVRDDALGERWGVYHLIGDTLRGTAAGGQSRATFAARLAAETPIVAPKRTAVRGATVRPARQVRTWLSAAAGVAAVGFVGWVAAPNYFGGNAPAPQVVQLAPPQEAPRLVAMPARGVQDYLLAHQRFSASSAMQGAAPYVRLVAEDTPPRAAEPAR